MYKPMRKSILLGVLFTTICFSTSIIASTTDDLSVKFIRFYAAKTGDISQVHWVTSSETNNDFFTVERSTDLVQWEVLEIVPGAGTSPGSGDYMYFDLEPKNGVNHYRIKQTDLDGAYDYSHIEKVEFDFFVDDIDEVAVIPNPVPGFSTSFIVNSNKSLVGTTVKLIDITGKEIPVEIDVNDTELTISPIRKIPGLYFLIIQKRQQSIVKKIKFD
jgi:hypothetical protein